MSFLVNLGREGDVGLAFVVDVVDEMGIILLASNKPEGLIMGKTMGVAFRSNLGLSMVVVDLIGDDEMGKATLLNNLGLVTGIDLILSPTATSISNDPALECRPSTATSSKSIIIAVSGVFNLVLLWLLILPHLDSAGTGESILQLPHVELASESTVPADEDEKVDEVDDRRRSRSEGGMGESLIPERVRLKEAEGRDRACG